MNCLIVDDQKAYHLILADLINLDPSLILVDSYTDAAKAYNAILNQTIDILFLDIDMPGMNGIELAKMLQEKGQLIIFTTSHTEYATEAYNLNVVDYLIKPIEPARFLASIKKVKAIHKNKDLFVSHDSDEFIFIRDSYTIRKIKTDDILYLESDANYVNIHMSSKKIYTIHSKLSVLEQKLPKQIFFRVHRSFIVNISKIDTIEGKTLIVDKTFIPIADTYRAALYNRIAIL